MDALAAFGRRAFSEEDISAQTNERPYSRTNCDAGYVCSVVAAVKGLAIVKSIDTGLHDY